MNSDKRYLSQIIIEDYSRCQNSCVSQNAYDHYGRQLNVNPHKECSNTPIHYYPGYEPKINQNEVKTITCWTLEDLNLRDGQIISLRKEIDKLNVEHRRKDKFWQSCFDAVVTQRSNLEEDLAAITLNAEQNQKIYELNIESLQNKISTKSKDLDNLLKEKEKLVVQTEEQLKINEDDKKNHESLIEFLRKEFIKHVGDAF
jgi:hypothetical protein